MWLVDSTRNTRRREVLRFSSRRSSELQRCSCDLLDLDVESLCVSPFLNRGEAPIRDWVAHLAMVRPSQLTSGDRP